MWGSWNSRTDNFSFDLGDEIQLPQMFHTSKKLSSMKERMRELWMETSCNETLWEKWHNYSSFTNNAIEQRMREVSTFWNYFYEETRKNKAEFVNMDEK